MHSYSGGRICLSTYQRLQSTCLLPQKCEQSAFCTRLRGAQGDAYSVIPESVSVKDSSVTAVLTRGSSTPQLDLALTAYQGTARLYINEVSEAGKQRFQVPHVLLASLDKLKTSWQDHAATSNSMKLSLGEADINLQYSPLQLDIAVGGTPAVSFNSRQLFNFEQLQSKQVLAPTPFCIA